MQVLPGEKFPVDGEVLQGSCSVDESMLTGESQLVAKQPGSQVPALGTDSPQSLVPSMITIQAVQKMGPGTGTGTGLAVPGGTWSCACQCLSGQAEHPAESSKTCRPCSRGGAVVRIGACLLWCCWAGQPGCHE